MELLHCYMKHSFHGFHDLLLALKLRVYLQTNTFISFNFRYDPYAFKEKSNYQPEFKLDYVDNKGRSLNQKEVSIIKEHVIYCVIMVLTSPSF